MIDVSDGLLADALHVARASGVVIDVDTAAFEVPEPLQAVAAATNSDPLGLILGGGDDHCLLATFPADVALPDGWRAVGIVREPGADGPHGHRRRRGVRRTDRVDALLADEPPRLVGRAGNWQRRPGQRPSGVDGSFNQPCRFVGSAGDLAGLQAAGADVHALRGAVDDSAHTLDVGVEAALGDLARPRPVVAEGRLLGADVAHGSHGDSLGWNGLKSGVPGFGQPEQISRRPPRG